MDNDERLMRRMRRRTIFSRIIDFLIITEAILSFLIYFIASNPTKGAEQIGL